MQQNEIFQKYEDSAYMQLLEQFHYGRKLNTMKNPAFEISKSNAALGAVSLRQKLWRDA